MMSLGKNIIKSMANGKPKSPINTMKNIGMKQQVQMMSYIENSELRLKVAIIMH